MVVRVGGRVHWLWRAVDEHGQTLDVLLQARRDTAAAARFFRRLLGITGAAPNRITTDKLGSYAAALAQLPPMREVEHLQVRSALRCNNRVEQAHQATRIRERVMRGFKSPTSAQRFLDAFAQVSNLFCPGRHRLPAAAYRATMRERAMAYLLAWRMALAKDLLRRDGTLTVAEVATRVGSGSASTFSVPFSRHVGRPPTHHAARGGRGRVEAPPAGA
jgi:AraC-like DNA-binding protein